MNNTKTIFKSLLIMIVAISLFTVSCSKDEGGTKTPTNPTPKNSKTLLTDMLIGLGELKDIDNKTVILDFATIKFDENGGATITGANTAKEDSGSDYKVKTVLVKAFKKINFNREIGLQAEPTVNNPSAGTSDALSVEIIFTANTDYTFDASITTGKRYSYTEGNKTAKLTLKIEPKEIGQIK